MMTMRIAYLLLVVGAAGEELENSEKLAKNPIRKVVTMLQDMQKTVEGEGKKEQDLFDKFMCYCSNGAGALDLAIQTGASNVEALTSQVAEQTAQKSQLQQDLARHKSDRTEAQKVLAESKTMREKEASEFASSSGEMKANVEASGNALAALKKGLGYAMLQTTTGDYLRNLVRHSPSVRENERETLLSFLDSSSTSQDSGSSDQIIGIVEQMKETMEGDLEEATNTENQAVAGYATLTESKNQEIAAAGKMVEEKTVRAGETAVSITQAKADLEDTQTSLEEDQKFKANLQKSCATKQADWDARCKLRAQEIAAISETVEMLNGDDALDLFKKTLPSASSALIQVSAASQAHGRAAMLIRNWVARDPEHSVNLKMMLLMLKGKTNGGFDKVVKMVDDMVTLLAKEQVDDDKKRDFCRDELDKADDEEKALKRDVHDVEVDIEEKEDNMVTLKAEIDALQKGMAALDKMVAEATEQRKEEHEDYTETVQSNSAAQQLIEMAKNRMNKFYNPSLYKAPPTTTASSSPYGFMQISLRGRRADPGPAPETFGEYKKSESSSGVIAMMTQMAKDVEMDTKEAEHDEKDAQEDYESTMSDAATKRADDSKLVVEKEGAKADLQVDLATARELRASKRDQLGIVGDKIDDLHKSCDFLLDNYDERKTSRAKESDGLKQAKAVLAGASFGL